MVLCDICKTAIVGEPYMYNEKVHYDGVWLNVDCGSGLAIEILSRSDKWWEYKRRVWFQIGPFDEPVGGQRMCHYHCHREYGKNMQCFPWEDRKFACSRRPFTFANLLQIRWDENEKRAYILDAGSAGGSVMEVPNPIDFQGSYEDFYLMLLKAFSYFDATDLVRKLHTQTLLISKSHIQNPSKVSEDKATTTCWLSIMCPHNSILHAGKQQSTDLCAGAVLMGNTNNS